jgi:hypothetical protein
MIILLQGHKTFAIGGIETIRLLESEFAILGIFLSDACMRCPGLNPHWKYVVGAV